METITGFFTFLNDIVWGPMMLVLILGTGLFLMLGLRLMPILRLGSGFKLLWQGRSNTDDSGEITPFQALMTALSATIGTGNIAGVATAVFMGGPGALFWMWCTALVGMATKFSEAALAVKYRETDNKGNHCGGPMYYIKNGLGSRWAWLGTVFALFGAVAGFGIGNTVQSNSVAAVLESNFSLPTWVTAIALTLFVGLVLIGGIRRIGAVASTLVPIMAISYLIAGLAVLFINVNAIPTALDLMFTHAFTPAAATGGFTGAAVWAAIRFGVARGVFSNEAGLGSAPIAHAAAKTSDPVRQGMIAMLGTFLDTVVVCSITGLVIITTGVWTSGATGAALTSAAFADALPGLGNYIVALSLVIFAYTTILGWSFYGERCVVYLIGPKAVKPYRILWIVALPIGATMNLEFVWLVADTLNAMMALPNLVALILLSPVVFKLVNDHFSNRKGHTVTPTP